MGGFVVLLALCLCYGSVRGDIQNLDDILKESIGKAMKTTIDGVDLSGLTVTFVEKVDYGEPDEISDEIVETITQEYENPSNEETTEEFEETYDHENQMSWILEDGLLTSSSPKIVASVTGQKGFDINAVISDEAQKTQEKTATKTLTKKATVKIPPNSKVTVAWNIVEKEVEIPWEVDVEISGDVGLTCDKKCSKPKSIEWLLRRKQLPEDIFTIEDGKLKFTASGTLVTVLAYSDALKIETEGKEGETTEGEAAETEGEATEAEGEASETAEPEIEEEPTEDDVAVADEDPKLAFVKGVLSIASDNLEPDSEYQPWIKMAGGIAELSGGNTDDPQVYLDIAESAIDIVNSEKGQAVIEKLKNVTKKVVNKVRGKAKTETEKCKPTGRGRRNRKPGCPSRKQPPTPKPTPGRPPARPTRRPRPTRKPRTQASTRPSNGRTQKTRKPRRTRKPRTPRPRRTTVRSRTTKARRTTKRTTKRPTTTKKTKKTTTKKSGRRNRG